MKYNKILKKKKRKMLYANILVWYSQKHMADVCDIDVDEE